MGICRLGWQPRGGERAKAADGLRRNAGSSDKEATQGPTMVSRNSSASARSTVGGARKCRGAGTMGTAEADTFLNPGGEDGAAGRRECERLEREASRQQPIWFRSAYREKFRAWGRR